MRTLNFYLQEPLINSYFLIFKKTKGSNPIINQWALNLIVKNLNQYIERMVLLIQKKAEPESSIERHVVDNFVIDESYFEDFIQAVYLSWVLVLKRKNTKSGVRLYDLNYFMFRELSKEVANFN